MKKRIVFIFIVFQVSFKALFAQGYSAKTDTSSNPTVLESFEHGHLNGYFRTFFMATDNTRQLTDYYALAAGGGLRYHTASFHGWSMGIGGVFNFNLKSTDLGVKDSLTGANNRYEIGLFDVENPYNREDLDRLDACWLRYDRKKLRFTLGRQGIQTPFINYQDGRMVATAVSGLWAELKPSDNLQVEGGWIWRIAPRSTVRWYSVGASIGLYPRGLNPDGTASGYPQHLTSKGIGLLGIKRNWGKRLYVQGWNQYVEHIFNTAFVQADYNYPVKNGHKILLGMQLVRQDALANGGNEDADKTYFTKGGSSTVISSQIGWERTNWQVLAAYTRIGDKGRFLTPREWGREQFYTFMTRERVEGSGDVHAVTGKINWHNTRRTLQIGMAYGQFYLPDIKNIPLNKYAFPAYRQFNADIRYTFGKALKGLQGQVIYVWKGRMGNTYGNDRYIINRVNMSHFDLIFNYIY